MADVAAAAVKHRWLRFSLRTLFVAVTFFGCWLGYELNWIRQRHEFLADEAIVRQRLPTSGVKVAITVSHAPGTPAPRAPAMLWAFGEDGYSTICVLADAPDVEQLTDRDQARVRTSRRFFWESTVMTVHVGWTATSSHAESAIPPN